MSLSADGGLIAVGTFEGDVVLVDSSSLRSAGAFHAHDRYAQVLFLGDGRLLTSGDDGPVLLWDAKAGRLLRTLGGEVPHAGQWIDTEEVHYNGELAASRDGKRIAYVANFKRIEIRDAGSGRLLPVPAKPVLDADDSITSMNLAPDGSLAAWGTWKGVVSVWDVARATVIWTSQIPGEVPENLSFDNLSAAGRPMADALTFSPDGRMLAVGGRGDVIMAYDARTGQNLSSIPNLKAPGPDVNTLVFLPDGKSLVAGYHSGRIRRLSLPDGKEEFSRESGIDGILDIAAAPDGKVIYSLENGGFLSVYAGATGAATAEGMNRTILSAAYSPDGRQLASAGSDGVIRIFSMPGGGEHRTLKAGDHAVTGLGFSHDGRMLASMGTDKLLRVWSSSSSVPAWEAAVSGEYYGNLAFTPDDSSLLSGDGRFLDSWDARTGAKRRRIGEHPANFSGLAVSPNGTYAAVADYDGRAYVWDIRSGKKIFAKPEHLDDMTNAEDVAFSQDGRQVIFKDRKTSLLSRYSVPDGLLLGEYGLPHVTSKVFLLSGGAGALVSVAGGGIGQWTTSAFLHDLHGGGSKAVFEMKSGVGDVVAVSPDGKFLATAGDDGALLVWPIPAH